MRHGSPRSGPGGLIAGGPGIGCRDGVGSAVRVGEGRQALTSEVLQRLPTLRQRSVTVHASELWQDRMRDGVEADGHAGRAKSRHVFRTQLAVGVCSSSLQVLLTCRVFFACCGDGSRLRMGKVQCRCDSLRAVVSHPGLEDFPPVGTEAVQGASGQKERGRDAQFAEHGKHVAEVGCVVVIEGDCEPRAARPPTRDQLPSRDDIAHREQRLHVFAELLDRHTGHDLVILGGLRAHPVVDEGKGLAASSSQPASHAAHEPLTEQGCGAPPPHMGEGSVSAHGCLKDVGALLFAGPRLATILRGYGNRMRIAHVTPTSERVASGVQTAVEELARALSRRGHDVEIWHVGDWSPPFDAREADQMRAAGVRFRRLSSRRRPGSLPVVDLPMGDSADVVHLHSVFVPSNTVIGRSWAGPVFLSPHGGYDPVSLKRSFLRKQVYSALYEKRMLRRSATVVALTEVEAAQVRAYAGDVVTAVVPNGVAARTSGNGGAAFRTRHGIPADARLALFVGRLDVRHKGLDRLVEASAAAPSWQFVLVGPDHRGGRRRLQQMAVDLGVRARLHFIGQLDSAALTDAYAAADLFVLSSRWEGLPMSLLEALAQGIPSLVTPDVDRLVPVSQSGAGWVSGASELSATLQAVATLPRAEWSRRAEAARGLARGYDWDDVAAKYEEVYRTALQRWTPGGATTRGASPR
jgi:glycosyltransferase involved in cell wall biosynthesis